MPLTLKLSRYLLVLAIVARVKTMNAYILFCKGIYFNKNAIDVANNHFIFPFALSRIFQLILLVRTESADERDVLRLPRRKLVSTYEIPSPLSLST